MQRRSKLMMSYAVLKAIAAKRSLNVTNISYAGRMNYGIALEITQTLMKRGLIKPIVSSNKRDIIAFAMTQAGLQLIEKYDIVMKELCIDSGDDVC